MSESGSMPTQILIYLDLFCALVIDAPRVRASIFSRSRNASHSTRERKRVRVRSHIYIHTDTVW